MKICPLRLRIFLSHNSIDKPIAENLATSLRNEGHLVFFDKTDLPPGKSFDDQIRKAIDECDLFLFLVSPESVSKGSFARTEIKFVQEKWKAPSGHVLAVIVRPVADTELPPYLKSVTYLRTEGNMVAETVHAVSELSSKTRGKKCKIVLSSLVTIILLISGYFAYDRYKPNPLQGDVIVSRFDGDDSTIKVGHQIEKAIREELDNNGLQNISLRFIDQVLTNESDANEIVESANAKAVIYGWRDANNINISIAVSPITINGLIDNKNGVGIVDILPADRSISLVVNDLQKAIKTTALYVVGQIFYASNTYDKGYKAMDAAMNNLPSDGSVKIKNIALVEFLKGRRSFSNGDFVGAAIHYVDAIKSNPIMAAAYNNLAITYAKLIELSDPSYSETGEEVESSLYGGEKFRELDSKIKDSNLSNVADWNMPYADRLPLSKLFEEAVKIDPTNSAIRYNEVATSWRLLHIPGEEIVQNQSEENYLTKDIDTEPFKQKLNAIIKDDPSIVGAYTMLGAIYFDDGECSKAVDSYKKSVKLSPTNAELHNNLGLSYFCEKRFDLAKAELQLALDYTQKASNTNLNNIVLIGFNLINVMLKAGDVSEAKKVIVKLSGIDQVEKLQKQKDLALLSAASHFQQHDMSGFKLALDEVEKMFTKEALYGELDHQLPPLDKLLKAWLLEMEKKHPEADKLLEIISTDTNKPPIYPKKYQIRYLNVPTALAWFDLIDKCAQNQSITMWGKGGDCLPISPKERIQYVLDMYQERLALSIFYRINMLYAGLACPYVYSFDLKKNTWKLETAILTNLQTKRQEGEQRKSLNHFDGKLLISEKELETSYIDQIYVSAILEGGSEVRFQAIDDRLDNKDHRYLILNQGQSKEIHFNIPKEGIKSINSKSYRITVSGYYVPYN